MQFGCPEVTCLLRQDPLVMSENYGHRSVVLIAVSSRNYNQDLINMGLLFIKICVLFIEHYIKISAFNFISTPATKDFFGGGTRVRKGW